MEIRKEEKVEDSVAFISEKQNHFGTFLGTGRDSCGEMVPQILIDLKKFLMMSNGLATEGIFRVIGDVRDIQMITEELSNPATYRFGGYFYPWGVHEVASLIKVFFNFFSNFQLN